VFYPKMFDRVFSILVNEKDFIVHHDSLGKEWLDIYQSEPSFKYTSQVYRPDVYDDFSTAGKVNLNQYQSQNQVNDITSVTKKYKASCYNNYPEVYTYYINVSLLKNLPSDS